jgi:cbb3-type cytochrome oxidase maturation protein
MSVVILLMLASLAVGLVFVGAFVWSVRSGQYEDTLTPSMRMLLDDAKTQVHSQPAGAAAVPDPVSENPSGTANEEQANMTSMVSRGRRGQRSAPPIEELEFKSKHNL